MKSRKIETWIIFSVLFFLVPMVHAQNKYALLVANSDYRHLPKLPNAVNEARNLSQELKKLDFNVMLLENASKEQFLEGISQFETELKAKKGIAFFHYGGHGVQANGENFLIPADADIPDEKRLSTRAVSINEILSAMDSAQSESSIVIIDACRDNPLPASSSRGTTRGLSIIGNAPKNTIIIYSAEAGKTAIDGAFTPTLTSMISSKNIGFSEILKEVRTQVFKITNGTQIPGEYSQLFTDIYLNGTDKSKQEIIINNNIVGNQKIGLTIGVDAGSTVILGPTINFGYKINDHILPFVLFRYAYVGLLTGSIYPNGWVLSPNNWSVGIGSDFYYLLNKKNGNKGTATLQVEYFTSVASGDYQTIFQTDQTSKGIIISALGGYYFALGANAFIKASGGVSYGIQYDVKRYHHNTGVTEDMGSGTKFIPQIGLQFGLNL